MSTSTRSSKMIHRLFRAEGHLQPCSSCISYMAKCHKQRWHEHKLRFSPIRAKSAHLFIQLGEGHRDRYEWLMLVSDAKSLTIRTSHFTIPLLLLLPPKKALELLQL